MSTRIKVCGCTSASDVAIVRDAGADAFGMIFCESPRRVSIDDVESLLAQAGDLTPVGVFADPSREQVEAFRSRAPRALVQFSGNESAAFVRSFAPNVIKVLHVADDIDLETASREFSSSLLAFDTHDRAIRGGTGRSFAWERVAAFARFHPVMIAGGLNAANVGACIRIARPFAVDVRSGVEREGRKDPELVRAFVDAVSAA